ncbi:MAG: hypothetical protein ACI90Z_001683, partial [Cyanobium sp.]
HAGQRQGIHPDHLIGRIVITNPSAAVMHYSESQWLPAAAGQHHGSGAGQLHRWANPS